MIDINEAKLILDGKQLEIDLITTESETGVIRVYLSKPKEENHHCIEKEKNGERCSIQCPFCEAL